MHPITAEAVNIPTAKRGPRGGRLDNPIQQPAARNSAYKSVTTENGVALLHRFDRHDAAATGIVNEKPWHHMAAHMLASNFSNVEVAKAAGVTPEYVAQLKTNAWFQELMATIAHKNAATVADRLAAEANASIDKLVELRDSAESERVQLTAANLLLEQAHGKAVQKTIAITQSMPAGSLKQRYDDIQAELAAIAKARETRQQQVTVVASEAGMSPVTE